MPTESTGVDFRIVQNKDVPRMQILGSIPKGDVLDLAALPVQDEESRSGPILQRRLRDQFGRELEVVVA